MLAVSGSTKAPARAPEIVALPEVAERPVREATHHHALVHDLVDRLAGELVLRHIAGRRVLDVGRGAPRITAWVGERAARLVVVAAEELLHGDRMPFEDASFDVVYCLRTLPHLGHDDASSRAAARSLLAEVARVLAPYGAALVQIENARPGAMHRHARASDPADVGAYTRTDTLADLVGMLPPTLDVARVHALGMLASPALLRLPLVGPVIERLDWWVRDRSVVSRLGASLLVVLHRVPA